MRWITAFMVLSWVSVAAHGQTLADVARQERARKKTLESRIVISDATIPSPASKVTASVVPDNKAIDNSTPAAGPLDNQGRDEKYWRGTFERARQDLKRAEDNARLLEQKLTDLNGQLLREGMALREKELRAAIETTKKEKYVADVNLLAAQQNIRDLEEELRRSGGLPGWAR